MGYWESVGDIEIIVTHGALLLNKNMRKIIVASKTQTTQYQIEGGLIQFAPAAIYAYWVSDYLYNNKKRQLLYPNEDVE